MASTVLMSLTIVVIAVTGYPTTQEELQPQDALKYPRSASKAHYIPVDIHQSSTELKKTRSTEPVISSKLLEHKSGPDAVAEGQHFFPSLSAIFPSQLSHLRPPLYPEHLYESRPTFKPHDMFGFGSGSFKDYSFPHTNADNERSGNLLGSGNFGVLRGGTYYPRENDDVLNDDIYSNYYRGNIDHGHQSIYPPNPLPKFKFGVDFFANFKDFADINSPTKTSYSEYYVVYNNPSTTKNVKNNFEVTNTGLPSKLNIDESYDLHKSAINDTPGNKISDAKTKLRALGSSLKLTHTIIKEGQNGINQKMLALS